jgi:hypothetical protein
MHSLSLRILHVSSCSGHLLSGAACVATRLPLSRPLFQPGPGRARRSLESLCVGPQRGESWDSGLAAHCSECLERCHVLRREANSTPENGHYATEALRMNKDHCSWNPWIKRSTRNRPHFNRVMDGRHSHSPCLFVNARQASPQGLPVEFEAVLPPAV